jgi:hypothetical protein
LTCSALKISFVLILKVSLINGVITVHHLNPQTESYCAKHSSPAEPAAALQSIEAETNRLNHESARMSTGSWQGAFIAMLVG